MANTILASLIRPASFSMTSSNSGPVNLTGVSVSGVDIKLASRLLKNRREDGTTIAHARIKTPIIVQVKAIAMTIDGQQNLSTIMRDIDGLYNISTRGILLKNLKLQRVEKSQSPEALSATPMMLVFAGIITQGMSRPVCVQQGDSSVINSGLSTLKSAATTVSDFAREISDKLGGVI